MQVTHPEASVRAVARDSTGVLLAVEHDNVGDAPTAQLDRAREPGGPAADDDGVQPASRSNDRTRAPQ